MNYTILILSILLGFSVICLRQQKNSKDEFGGLKGKTWLVIGDSISEHNYRATKNYDEYISKWLGVKVINVAASGTGYINEFKGVKSWLDRVNEFPEKVDFITVMGALNDRTHPVGSFDDKDTATLYGGLHAFYQKLIEKYPGVPILIITSTPREYSYGEDGQFTGHVNAVIQVANYYKFPVLDLYRNSGMQPWDDTYKKEYFSCKQAPDGDGVHPNAKGQLIIANQIKEFIIQNIK